MALTSRHLWATAAVAACSLATQAQAALVYSLASDGTALVRFDSATPGAVTTVGPIAGATNRLDGMDFRPGDGLLYGYNHATGSAYTVDPNTGAVTFAAALSAPTNTNFLGIDFNPQADRLRIVTNSEQNLRVNLAGGATLVDGALAYAPADVNFGVDPSIIDAAYTNSSLGTAANTALYYIDYFTNSLVSTTNPNGGALNTVGLLGFDITADSGFDIYSDGSSNTAFAQFRVGGVNGLYSIDLATGAASLLGTIGHTGAMYGLAVVPGSANVVPESGSLALLGAAGLAALAMRRRRPVASAHTA
jgi:hypothetical protein